MLIVTAVLGIAAAAVMAADTRATALTRQRPSSAHHRTTLGEFALLSSSDTDVCRDLGDLAAIERYVNSLPPMSHMQGSCCTPMDLRHFSEQVNELTAYASIASVPPDPYDMSKQQAQQLLEFYNRIRLDNAELRTYGLAGSQTTDHGWCCCKCWAWYAHAGLAKYVTSRDGFDAQQTARLTDLEACCGGPA